MRIVCFAVHLFRVPLVVCIAAMQLTCGGRNTAPEWPDIVLIGVDTLRADHLGVYGYERNTSPNIDAFARDATVYARSIAASSWTLPSFATMFTGAYPSEHGARTAIREDDGLIEASLPQSQTTIAETLRKYGYRTGAFCANYGYLGERFQLDQGFDTYFVEYMYGEALNEHVFEWLDTPSDNPAFLFVNYMDSHVPYNVSPRPEQIPGEVSGDPTLIEQLFDAVMPGDAPVPEGLAREVIRQYDTGIANLDLAVGALIDKLRASGRLDNTLFILTSDHGEFFGEHQLVLHGKDLYEEGVHVPLIVRTPGQRTGERRDEVISGADIPRMILDALPIRNRETYRKIYPNAPGNHPVISEVRFARAHELSNPDWGERFNRIRIALYDWPYKALLNSNGPHEMYHLEHDPTEQRTIADDKPEIMERFIATFEEYRNARRFMPDDELVVRETGEDTREALRALGYL